MFQVVRCKPQIALDLAAMLDELGEPPQTLSSNSPRPLVVHRTMGQLTLVVGGRGQALLDNQVVALGSGDLLMMAPGCKHSFAAVDGDLRLRHWHWPQALRNKDRVIVSDQVDFEALPVVSARDVETP